VGEFLHALGGEQLLGAGGHVHVEVDPVRPVEQKLPSNNLIKQASQRPNIRGPGRANLLPPIIMIGLLLGLQCQSQHFRRFNALSAPRLHVELVLVGVVDFTLTEIPKNHLDVGFVVGVDVQQDVVRFYVVVGYALLVQGLYDF
jgi:hypothetical protein